MDITLLKEPLGFIRFLEWVFAIAAFATCANFTTQTKYQIQCKAANDGQNGSDSCFNIRVKQQIRYPFNLDDIPHDLINMHTNTNFSDNCTLDTSENIHHPGDYHFNAELFVLTGVLSWIVATAYLLVYACWPHLYVSSNSKAPIADFCTALMIAVFWLVASSVWAHGLIGLKGVSHQDWLDSNPHSPCTKKNDGNFTNIRIIDCFWRSQGFYGGADASVWLGFLNCFLWICNLWFIFKETSWHSTPSFSQPTPIPNHI